MPGNPPEGGFETDDAAEGGRQPDGAARIAAQGSHALARGHRGGRAAAGAAGDPVRVPGIARGAVMGVDAGGPEGELVHLQLAHEYGPGAGEPLGHRGVEVGHEAAQYLRSHGSADAPGVVEVLETYRNSVQRSPVLPPAYLALRSGGLLEGLVGQEGDEGVEDGLGGLDAPEVFPGQFHRGDLPRLDQGGGLRDRKEAQLSGVHGRSPAGGAGPNLVAGPWDSRSSPARASRS